MDGWLARCLEFTFIWYQLWLFLSDWIGSDSFFTVGLFFFFFYKNKVVFLKQKKKNNRTRSKYSKMLIVVGLG